MSESPGSACFGLQRDARSIFHGALRQCSVQRALATKLQAGAVDTVGRDAATVRVEGVRRLLLIAMGKGAATMLHALLQREDIVGTREVRGILVAPEQPAWLPASMQYIPGSHPTPDANSRLAAEAILQLLREEPAGAATLCFFLISGGASAMVELPLDSTIGLEDTAAFHRALVHSGAPIVQINALRKHFSAVKGGRMAIAAQHLRCITLLMSDVPPDQLDALASGPTLPDTSTVAECRSILSAYNLDGRLPATVRAFFRSATLPETPKPGQISSDALVLLSEVDLRRAAASAAAERGYVPVIDDSVSDGHAADTAQTLLERFRMLKREHARVCLVSTGESVVEVPTALQGKACGGRNQHLVLECAVRLTSSDADFAVLSCGSDGVDGNSSAAGAVIASADFRAPEAQRRALGALGSFESNRLLSRMGCAIETGPTGINLRDLRLLLG